MNLEFKDKYLKYKKKYLDLRKKLGGASANIPSLPIAAERLVSVSIISITKQVKFIKLRYKLMFTKQI